MNRRDFSKRRDNDKRESATGLVLLGLLIVALAWLSILRPRVLDSLSLEPASSPIQRRSERAASGETVQAVPLPEPATAPQIPIRETPPAPVEPATVESGDFCRYTDENDVIHIVNDPANVPGRYRSRIEVVASGGGSGGGATQVACNGNRVLVPVTLRYRGREVEAVLLLDTGATLTTIDESVASQLGINRSDVRDGTATVADGRVVPAFHFLADSLSVGPRSLSGAAISILPGSGGNGAEGLLGMNFLKEFRYHVDFRRGIIEWGS